MMNFFAGQGVIKNVGVCERAKDMVIHGPILYPFYSRLFCSWAFSAKLHIWRIGVLHIILIASRVN